MDNLTRLDRIVQIATGSLVIHFIYLYISVRSDVFTEGGMLGVINPPGI